MIKIIIACGGGFSSSHLVTILNRELPQTKFANDVVIDFLHDVDYKKGGLDSYDIIMCCPHLKMQIPRMIEEYHIQDIPLYVIPPRMYGLISANELITDAIEVIKRFKESKVNPFYFPNEEDILKVSRTRAYVHVYPK